MASSSMEIIQTSKACICYGLSRHCLCD